MSVRPSTASSLLIATAIIEIGAGVPLLLAPALVAQVLLGAPLPSPASLLVARIAGAALFAIGVSCWLERRRPAATPVPGLIGGLLVYNAVVFALLLYAALAAGLRGLGTLPACALHLAMALWCVQVLRAGRPKAAPYGDAGT